MEFLQAFPIAIIDEDYESKSAAGRGMRQLAAAIEKEGLSRGGWSGVGGEFPIKRQSGSETDRGNAAAKRDDQTRQE